MNFYGNPVKNIILSIEFLIRLSFYGISVKILFSATVFLWWNEQIVFANKIILNKIDLINEDKDEIEKITKRIKEINPFVTILPTSHSKIDIAEILNIKAFNLEGLDEELQKELKNADDASHNHDLSVKSTSVIMDGDMN